MATLAWGLPHGTEYLVILLVALLVFGKRLPDLGRSMGRTLIEFKKGLKDTQNEVEAVKADVTAIDAPDRPRLN